MNSDTIRLGLLGCGEITKIRHLPAAVEHPCVHVTALVDSDLERAKNLREVYGLDCWVGADYKEAIGRVDAVINALPNYLHSPVSVELLSEGIHVLCEKPLAPDSEAARACYFQAIQQKAVLAVGMPRRFWESTGLMNLVLQQGLLGSVLGYDWENGMPFEWRTASGFYFSPAQAGGGVLLDEGIHMLDCLLHWFGAASCLKYLDDNWGGVEANVEVHLKHERPGGNLKGSLRLSRTYGLKNRLLVYGSKACAEIPRGESGIVIVHRKLGDQDVSMTLSLAQKRLSAQDAFRAELDNFIQSIKGYSSPAVTGLEALQTIELIESCYRQATRIPEPWLEEKIALSQVRA